MKRDFALIKHGHNLSSLLDVLFTSVADKDLIQYDAASGKWKNVPPSSLTANPTALVGLTAVNGSASTFMRSDAAPRLDQAIIPTWTGLHTFNVNPLVSNTAPGIRFADTDDAANTGKWLVLASSQLFRIFAANDAENAFGQAFSASHGAGGAVSALTFGNATNNPTYDFLGNATTTMGGILDVNGNVIFVGNTGTGSGGNIRAVDDTGTARWLYGITGTAASTGWALYNLVGSNYAIQADESAGTITALTFGNAAHNPLHTFLGRVVVTTPTGVDALALNGVQGRIATINSTHANGPYETFLRSGAAFADIGNGPQMFSGGTLDGLGFTTRGTQPLEFGTASTLRWQMNNSGQFLGPNGTASLPSISFVSDPDTGLFRAGANAMALVSNGITVAVVNSSGANPTFQIEDGGVAIPGLGFDNDPDTGLYRQGANIPAMTAGGAVSMSWNGQLIRVGDGFGDGDRMVFFSNIAARSASNLEFYINRAPLQLRLYGYDGSVTTGGSFRVDPQLQAQAGTAAIPGYSFSGDTDTGMFNLAANQLGFAGNGLYMMKIIAGIVQTRTETARGSGNLYYEFFDPTGSKGYMGYGGSSDLFIINNGLGGLKLDSTWVQGPDGTVSLPAYSFSADPNTGIYRSAADVMRLATGGVDGIIITNTEIAIGANHVIGAIDGTVGAPAYTFDLDLDTGIYRYATNTIGFTAGGTVSFWVAASQAQLLDGSAGTPALSFVNDTNTGMYRTGADDFGISTGGTLRWDISTTAITSTLSLLGPAGAATAGNLTYGFSGDTDTGFYSLAANQIGIALGGAAYGGIATGNFTGTLTGMTAGTTGTVEYRLVGKQVTLFITANITGTSNTTAMTMTGLPAIVQPTNAKVARCFNITDTGNIACGQASVAAGTITFLLDAVSGTYILTKTFTAAGFKGLTAGWMIVYSLD